MVRRGLETRGADARPNRGQPAAQAMPGPTTRRMPAKADPESSGGRIALADPIGLGSRDGCNLWRLDTCLADLDHPAMSESTSRQQDEKDRRRDEILDAAERVLREQGFDAAKMQDIATRARVSRALVYLYFKDKAELHFAIGLRALELLRARFQQARARHKTGLDQLRAIGHAYLVFAQEFPVYFQAISRFEGHQATPDEEGAQKRMMMAGRLVHAELITALMIGQQDGTIRKDIDAHIQVAITLWGFTHGVAQLLMTKASVLEYEGISMVDFVNDAMEMAIRAVRA